MESSIPLAMVLRDYLHICDTGREARRIIGAGEIQVDGKVRKDYKHAVGFMEVLGIPKTGQYFRILLSKGRLQIVEIPPENSTWKLARIEDKTTLKGGKTQLNLHDGRNMIVEKGTFKTGDVLKISVPEQKVLDRFAFAEGGLSLVIGGSHAGKLATIKNVVVTRNPKENIVNMQAGEKAFSTIKPYVFRIGKDKPEIVMPEVNILE